MRSTVLYIAALGYALTCIAGLAQTASSDRAASQDTKPVSTSPQTGGGTGYKTHNISGSPPDGMDKGSHQPTPNPGGEPINPPPAKSK